MLRTKLVSQFSCLGDRCSDTCCRGWSMQVDEPTRARYKAEAPELLNAVEPGGPGAPWIMRKDVKSGYCVKFENGWCGIQKAHGAEFLGDACHFYPRVTRALGDRVIMTASSSCPEIARLMLASDDALVFEEAPVDRLPESLKNYLPEGITEEDALAVHQAFLSAVNDKTVSPEKAFARIASVGRSFARLKSQDWPGAIGFYLRNADARIPPPLSQPADPFNLLLALAGLVVAAQKPLPERLQQTIEEMETALAVKIDWQKLHIHTDEKSTIAYREVKARWQAQYAAHYSDTLRRYLAAQLSLNLYPFAGLGNNLIERTTILGVRFATFKLALMCACAIREDTLPEEILVRVAQSLARFLDHLGDAVFSLQIYGETGWADEAKMCGLLEI